jgi:hypothetical protein
MTTYTQATDDMFGLFRAAWNAGAAAIVGSIPPVVYQGVEPAAIIPADSYWCRVSRQSVYEKQATLKTAVALDVSRRYNNTGLLFVQLFCPLSDSQAMDKGSRLAVLIRDAFRGKESANNVWFRNVRIRELASDEGYIMFNIIAEYDYDDIG